MKGLREIFSLSPEFVKIETALKKSYLPAAYCGMNHIAKVLTLSALAGKGVRSAVICPTDSDCVRFREDLENLGVSVGVFPVRDYTLIGVSGYGKEYERKRTGTLSNIIDGAFDVVLIPADASVSVTVPKKILEQSTFSLSVGDTAEENEIIERLVSGGYVRTDAVEGIGQFAVRGGIIDVFPPDHRDPVRIDLFGDEVDKITSISVETQRSTETLRKVKIRPSAEVFCSPSELSEKLTEYKKKIRNQKRKAEIEKDIALIDTGIVPPLDRYLNLIFDKFTTVFDYIEDRALFVSESASVTERMKNYIKITNEEIKSQLEEGFSDKNTKLTLTAAEFQEKFSDRAIFLENFPRSGFDMPLKDFSSFSFLQPPQFTGNVNILCSDLESYKKGDTAVVLAGTAKGAEVLDRELRENGIKSTLNVKGEKYFEGISVSEGHLSDGITVPSLKLSIITGTRATKKGGYVKRRKDAKPYGSLDELTVGDYVVHASHGIGLFDGITSMSVEGVKKDYIKIKYAKDGILYVPVTQLDLVSKYIGARENGTVKLNRLGTNEWAKTRSRVRHAVKDMAKQLSVLYAKRMAAKGYAFSPDTDLQSDFESRFIYEETEDQLRCTDEIKRDMEAPRPMDRLLCGDVGFGKTEVALRAAFKCISEGKQCAILVPTTILAWQHFNTATERIGNLPVNIEMISRFRTKKQQTEIIRKVRSGEIDLLIGTHRLISSDITFRDLGLVIIDEEQRFGVEQKEKLKERHPSVDILTLTATPIPRTLNMAMTGLRDMSAIEEAPEDRLPVQTYVLEQDDGVLYEAISKELRRGGQVYYLHNRVESIDSVAIKIKAHFPDAVIETAHGKMSEDVLSKVWERLIRHEIDILVCTTIIETGVDVPNANTLIIEDADRMGLSSLHQLRGRVGRSARRAYAYFVFRRGKVLSEVADKRLRAIREFTNFGSGFKIAMRDLEIRGAGSILGGEQHGHMEAVGYEMYLKMLADAIKEEKGETPQPEKQECLVDLPLPAHIPDSYIASTPQRLGAYKRIADIDSEEDMSDVLDEFIDRFGDPPSAVITLMQVSLLRASAQRLGITEIGKGSKCARLYFPDITCDAAAKLCETMHGRAYMRMSPKPHIVVEIENERKIAEELNEIMKKL